MKQIATSAFQKTKQASLLFLAAWFTMMIVSNSTSAAETEYRLEPVVVKASSSFDSLSEDTYLPQKKLSFDHPRGGTLESFEKSEAYPSQNLGYPSGAFGSAMGGRSIDDVQVSTLGVPLNLPQGGGPDLSTFPAFLWSGASFNTVPSSAGFSSQGVSGSMQFDLWTRTQVREHKFSSDASRVSGSVDRNVQNFSVGTKKENIAMIAGMNLGRQKGPAGSLSYYFIRKPRSHFIFHLLGTDQDGDNPGSKSTPTPTQRKKAWRVIPALESHQEFGEDDDRIVWESTFYADLEQLILSDPTKVITSDRSQRYGVENAIHWGPQTLALTGRLVNYHSSTFGDVSEWPILAQYSYEFQLNSEWKSKVMGGVNTITSVGTEPVARASFKYTLNPDSNWFFEMNTLAKMPTLTARYYVDSFFHGNSNLKTERVNTLIAGYESKTQTIASTTTLKGEYRTQTQVYTINSMINDGNAFLGSIGEDLKWKVSSFYETKPGVLFTVSRISNTKSSYPDLPHFSGYLESAFDLSEQFKINHHLKYVGVSSTSWGANHPDYLLMDLALDYSPTPGTTFTLGCDNITDKRAEVVLDYPLPGRVLYLNLVANF